MQNSSGRCLRVAGTLLFLLFASVSLRTEAAPASRRWKFHVGGGTVLDNWTGLLWQRHPPTTGAFSGVGLYAWNEALQYCQNLVLEGYTDWRLPRLQELQTIIDRRRSAPSISPYAFPNTPLSNEANYWTATTRQGSGTYAWYVSFYAGSVNSYYQMTPYRVRCVR